MGITSKNQPILPTSVRQSNGLTHGMSEDLIEHKEVQQDKVAFKTSIDIAEKRITAQSAAMHAGSTSEATEKTQPLVEAFGQAMQTEPQVYLDELDANYNPDELEAARELTTYVEQIKMASKLLNQPYPVALTNLQSSIDRAAAMVDAADRAAVARIRETLRINAGTLE